MLAMTDSSKSLIKPLITLATKKFGQLEDVERKLFEAIERQEVANFKSDEDEANQLESAEKWGSERTLKADRLVWLLTTPEVSKFLSFRGLRISGAKIEGELNLESATVSVPLIFETCAFTEPLILQKSKLKELQLKGSYVPGIQAKEMRVEGSVFLGNGFQVFGEVNLIRASIGGRLNCFGGKFHNEGKTAIDADAATIAADVFLRNEFEAFGEVNLRGASIGGQLSCSGGEFHNNGKTAIDADAATITADVFLSNGFEAFGMVNLRGASIGGQLGCIKGEFHNKGKTAIQADAAKIAADVLLRDGFEAFGMVNLTRASIGGNIECQGGQFLNKIGYALYAEGATIGGSVFLGGKSENSQFQAEGKIIFLNASIDDRLELESIVSNNSQSMTLDLRFAKVNTFSFTGRQAEESWIKHIQQGELFLKGFVYSTINVSNDAIKNKDLLKWLQLQIKKDPATQSENGFVLQPYEQLAEVLEANGHQEAATKVLIAKEDDRLKYGSLGCWGKVWNGILGVTIAHGYRPQKALLYSVVMILLGWGVFYWHQGLMTETNDKHESYAVFNPLVYSIDTFTPIIDLHQQKMWLPDASKGQERGLPLLKRRGGDWLRRYFWAQIIAGWVLTSLWVAGFTGLVRNKN